MKTLYECEVCGSRYYSQKAALHCESIVLPLCPLAVGDTIKIKTRYNGIETDVIEKITIEAGSIVDWVEHYNDEQFEDYLSRFDENDRLTFHEYTFHTKDFHQLGKDDIGNTVTLHNLEGFES